MTFIHRSKQLVRRGVAAACFHSGLLDRYRRYAMRGRAVVLLYHRVVGESTDLIDYSPSGMTVRRDEFERQMAYLKQHYSVVRFAELVDTLLRASPLGDSLCAITFDDGWRDNFVHALPVLKRLGLPATIFLATNFVNRESWFWEERLKYLIGHIAQRHTERRLESDERRAVDDTFRRLGLETMTTPDLLRLRRFLTNLVNQVRQWSPEDRQALLSRLETLVRLEHLAEPRRFMNWDEIRAMEASGIDFGAHTLTHMNLERCDVSLAEAEIRGSKAVLEHEVANAVPFFAYPYGKNTPEVRDIVAGAGFRAACTTTSGWIRPGDDLFLLNRIDIRSEVAGTLPYFACRVLQVLHAY